MKLTELHIKDYNQFEDFKLDLTYPEGHRKAGQALDKVCFIGQSGTGKTSLIELIGKTLDSIISTSQKGNEFSYTKISTELQIKFDNGIVATIKLDHQQPLISFIGEKTYMLYLSKANNPLSNINTNKFYLSKIYYFPDYVPLQKQVLDEKTSFNKDANFINFGEVDFKENWSLINDAIIKDRELEIKNSLETSKALQNSELSNDDILKIRQNYINWRKSSPNPIVDLAENFLDKILNRFNLKVKTELDFERKEDIETIKIQTRQGEDIPFDALSTGTKQVILTALPLYGLKPEKAIILFDEPERSLYPDIQKEIVDFYTSMAKDSQFFFATHSPLIASSFEPWEIIELKFNEKGKVYQEKYYEGEKHVDNYTINPQYLTWTGILQKVFDLEQESNPLRDRQLIELATLESKLKHNSLTPEKKKETFEKYQKLATLLNWELK
ncbi:AAA family ATPase [Flectobacillus longus]|uniref:AAA family ATPase n=1 Tax=Flectobacillus longus TaxID=2984207 RepID=UPI0024B7850B|nr:ATP-binding protein [Flectobacillus longus]MDI9880804.1 ATP-binding protein [Flectobacillus longus]